MAECVGGWVKDWFWSLVEEVMPMGKMKRANYWVEVLATSLVRVDGSAPSRPLIWMVDSKPFLRGPCLRPKILNAAFVSTYIIHDGPRRLYFLCAPLCPASDSALGSSSQPRHLFVGTTEKSMNPTQSQSGGLLLLAKECPTGCIEQELSQRRPRVKQIRPPQS